MTKRIVSILLAIMMILTALPVIMASANALGNLNNDAQITAADARIALRASVGLETLNEAQKAAADVNFDGTITAADARLILRASVGLEDLHTHDYKTETVITAATCTAAGEKKLTCECGEFIKEAIPAKGHTSVTDKAVAATCTATGKTEGSHCSDCNTVLKAQTTTNKIAHKPAVDQSTKKNATCKENGYTGDTKCTVCKTLISKGNVIPSTGKEHVTEYVNHEATCGQNGYKIKECKFCDYYDESSYQKTADAKPHSWGPATTVKPTCTEEGYTVKTCTRLYEGEPCGAIEKTNIVAATGHSLTTKETIKAATCKEEGSKISKCTKCVYETTEIIPLTDHNLKSGSPENEPCRTIKECTYCDFVDSDKTTHTIQIVRDDTFKPATCEEDGAGFRYCTKCDKYGTDTKKINNTKTVYGKYETTDFATGHQPSSTREIEPRTCSQDGIYVYTGECANGCGKSFDGTTPITIPLSGHKLTGEQTCTTAVTCENSWCEKENNIIDPALGHDIHLSTAAFTEEVTTFFCARCGVEPEKNNKANTLSLFNTLTNNIKAGTYFSNYTYRTYGNSLLSYISKSSIETSYSRFDFGMFTTAIKSMYEEEVANSPDEYSKVQSMSFKYGLPVDDEYISKLTVNDIDSIKAERFSGVKISDILSSFNPTYTKESDTQKYEALKNAKDINENVIKVTINVKNEKYTEIIKNNSIVETALQKVFGLDIREEAKDYAEQPPLNEGGEGFSISMTTVLNDIATDGELTYYFLESTYEPVVAVYNSELTITQEIDMKFQIALFSLDGEMDPIIKTKTTSVYVFPKFLEE